LTTFNWASSVLSYTLLCHSSSRTN